MIATLLLYSMLFQDPFSYIPNDYSPLSGSELANRFPVKYLGTIDNHSYLEFIKATRHKPFSLPHRVRVGVSGATVAKLSTGGLLITGKDKNGSLWKVNLNDHFLDYSCQFYSADLDCDGIRDLVVIYPTDRNGLAPLYYFFSLTFDEQGRPVPFIADSWFGRSTPDIPNLVDLDRDGRAEFISMDCDDGYWITDLYEVSEARWQRAREQHGRRSYPLYTRYTYRANRKPVVPARGRRPASPDLSNNEPFFRGRIISVKDRAGDIKLVMRAEEQQKITNMPLNTSCPFALVLDSAQRRTIFAGSSFWSEEEEKRIKSLLKKFAARGYQVALYGRQKGSDNLWAGLEIIWASQTPASSKP
jgi:hypothetical protein